MSLLELPSQRTTNWVAGRTENDEFTVLEAGSLKLRYRQGWFLLRAVREGSFLGCTWLSCTHDVLVCMWVSEFPSFYEDINHFGLGPTPVTSF